MSGHSELFRFTKMRLEESPNCYYVTHEITSSEPTKFLLDHAQSFR